MLFIKSKKFSEEESSVYRIRECFRESAEGQMEGFGWADRKRAEGTLDWGKCH